VLFIDNMMNQFYLICYLFV